MAILERDTFLDQLQGYLDEAAQGRGRLLFLCAEAGGGKTTLVEQFAAATPVDIPVAILSCDGLKMPGPFGPIFDFAEVLGSDVQSLLAEQAPRDQVYRAVLTTLRRATKPHVIVGEDAHWTDEATLEMIRFLGRRIGSTRALIIVTYRDDALDPFHPLRRIIGDLISDPAVIRLQLPPLTIAAVRELAADTGLDPVSLHERTGGNPFYVTEIIGAGSDVVPESIREAVLGRASRLSPEARALLDAASVFGVIVDPDLLAATIGAPIADLVDEALAAGILRDAGDRIAFRHGLTRDVFLTALSPPRRRDLHRRVLHVMESDPVHTSDLAHLAYHAAEAHDREAVLHYAPSAGRQAAAFGAHREAAAQYERALRFAQALPDTDVAELLEARSYECYLTGQLEDAINDRARAAGIRRDTGDPLRAGDNLRWLSRFCWFAGRNADAERHARAALTLLEPLPPGRELAMAYSNLSQLKMLANEIDEAVAWGDRAIALAITLGDEPIHAHALTNVGSAKLMIEDPDGRRLIEQSIEIARAHSLHDDVARAYANLAWNGFTQAELEDADHFLAEGLAYTSEHALTAMELYLRSTLASVWLARGAWGRAIGEFKQLISQPSANPPTRIVGLCMLGLVAARRGDDPWDYLDQGLALAASADVLMRAGQVRAVRAEAAWLAGDLALTAAEASELYAIALQCRNRWLAGAFALWQHRAGQTITELSEIAEPFALEISGDGHAAAAFWRSRGFPLETARALASTGEEPALREALAIAEELGARPDAARIIRLLRQAGATSIPRGPRPTTQANPAGLTVRELEILPYLAQGLTNQAIADALFLSPRTVGHHVSAILGKLDVTTRGQAAARASELGLLESPITATAK